MLLGTFIDKTTRSRAGDDFKGVSLGLTQSHSLGTTPDTVMAVLRSVQEVGAQAPLQVLGLGGNASILTFGFAGASAASAPTILYDLYAIYWMSMIR